MNPVYHWDPSEACRAAGERAAANPRYVEAILPYAQDMVGNYAILRATMDADAAREAFLAEIMTDDELQASWVMAAEAFVEDHIPSLDAAAWQGFLLDLEIEMRHLQQAGDSWTVEVFNTLESGQTEHTVLHVTARNAEELSLLVYPRMPFCLLEMRLEADTLVIRCDPDGSGSRFMQELHVRAGSIGNPEFTLHYDQIADEWDDEEEDEDEDEPPVWG
jgi:hypothetical protein